MHRGVHHTGPTWYGATPAPYWAGGYAGLGYDGRWYDGFGLDVPWAYGVANVDPTKGYCGSIAGLQQMLAELGFYKGTVDGKWGSGTQTAVVKFAQANLPPGALTAGINPTFCQAVIDKWQALHGPPPGTSPPAPSGGTSTGKKMISPTVMSQIIGPFQMGPGGATTTTGAEPAVEAPREEGVMGWWSSQSTGTKVAIGIGAAAVVGLAIYALMGAGGAAATPNPRRGRRRRARRGRRVRGARSRARKGRVLRTRGGKRLGHRYPPKRYWQKGARRSSDYAWPSGYQYPLVFRTKRGRIKRQETARHCRSALSRFARHKRRYPPKMRRAIARNMLRTCPRYIHVSDASRRMLARSAGRSR